MQQDEGGAWWLKMDKAPLTSAKHPEFPFWNHISNLEHHTSYTCIEDDFLYLGDLESATRETLESLGITRVVSIINDFMFHHLPTHLDAHHHLRIEADDNEHQSLCQAFADATRFIDECHRNKQRVLVHCAAGISRSASLVIAYFMIHRDMSLEQAYTYVKAKRPVITPNLGFMRQLKTIQKK